jgi:hypothetical protein
MLELPSGPQELRALGGDELAFGLELGEVGQTRGASGADALVKVDHLVGEELGRGVFHQASGR